jgi:hypothetical protein
MNEKAMVKMMERVNKLESGKRGMFAGTNKNEVERDVKRKTR